MRNAAEKRAIRDFVTSLPAVLDATDLQLAWPELYHNVFEKKPVSLSRNRHRGDGHPSTPPLFRSGHRTLRLVHLELESPREETSDIRHHSLPRSSAADVNVAVVRISHEAVLTSLELVVQFVEYDVR